MNKTSSKQLEYAKKHDSSHYDGFHMRFPKGKLAKYKKLADSKGISLTSLINELLEKETKNNI